MLRISQIPAEEEKCELYTVTINGIPADVYPARVSAYPYNYGWPGHQRPLEQTEMSAFVSFESDEPVTLEITRTIPFTEAVVRPLSKGVAPVISGNVVTFTLTETGQYSLELDGYHHNLHIFADPPSAFDSEDATLYFGPGVHHPGAVWLENNAKVYLDRDAVVYGSFLAASAENVTICGRGVIDGSYEKRTSETLLLPLTREEFGEVGATREIMEAYGAKNKLLNGAIRLYHCHHCTIEGVICRDSSTFTIIPANCSHLHIDNVKMIGMWRYNSDGIDLFNCQDVLIENTFLRNFDDCMVVKGIKGWDHQNVKNIIMRKLVVWCDWGRALEIGAETCADEYENILFEDCDVIHAAYSMCDVQNGDRAFVHDVTFRNIRCEYTKYQLPDVLQTDMSAPYDPSAPLSHPRIILVKGYTGQWSNDGIAGRTEGIRFENIICWADEGIDVAEINISGYAENHASTDIVIDGVIWNGRRLSKEACNLCIGPHVRSLTVK